MAGKRWRQLAVWLHVVSGVGWMAQALALVSLISFGLADPARQPAAMAKRSPGSCRSARR